MSKLEKLEVRRLTGALGAEIRGVDLKNPIDDEMRARLRAELLQHLVLFFPDQHLTNSQHKAFGATWAKLVTYEVAPVMNEDPEIAELVASAGKISDVWHADQTFQPNPPMGSVLNMIKSPSFGGDTMWSNQYLAYENLATPIREMVDGLTAIHQLPSQLRKKTAEKDDYRAEHPVVGVHPETGRRFLYVNRSYTARIPQLPPNDSNKILEMLFEHAEDPRFAVRYHWSEGTIAIWDNRCTQHCVINDFEGERIIRRVTLGGETREKPQSPWPNYQASRDSQRGKMEVA